MGGWSKRNEGRSCALAVANLRLHLALKHGRQCTTVGVSFRSFVVASCDAKGLVTQVPGKPVTLTLKMFLPTCPVLVAGSTLLCIPP